MRNEDDRLLDSIDESMAVARGAGCPLKIAHLKTQGPSNWGTLDAVFARVAAARAQGLDVMFDPYPYIAYQPGLHQSLSGLEPRRRHGGVPGATLRSGRRAAHPGRDAGEGGALHLELACIKDATGMARARASAAKPNLTAAKDPNELRPIELVDPETGRTELAYRRE